MTRGYQGRRYLRQGGYPRRVGWEAEERVGGKRDRAARLMRVTRLLAANPEGMRPSEIATRLGMSVRNVYRDLHALEDEVEVPVWSEGGQIGRASCRERV